MVMPKSSEVSLKSLCSHVVRIPVSPNKACSQILVQAGWVQGSRGELHRASQEGPWLHAEKTSNASQKKWKWFIGQCK